MTTPDLILDPALKYWVLLPILYVMVVIGLFRSNLTYLFSLSPKLPSYRDLRQAQFLLRAQNFARNNSVLTLEEFENRRKYFTDKLQSTVFYAKLEDPNQDAMAQFADSNTNEMLFEMAKSNLLGYVPQALTMGWVNFFFAGFVIMKFPFPLTAGFKAMLQSGVATPDLDASYVLAISWYFANLLGLRPIYLLIMGSSEADALIQLQLQQQAMPNMGGPGMPKASKVFNSEAENMHLLQHESIFDGIAERVLDQNLPRNPQLKVKLY